jgi:hypothetical protein
VDRQLWQKIRRLANQQGVSEETLLDIFLKERIEQLEQEQQSLTIKSA